MAAEFFMHFEDKIWYQLNSERIESKVQSLGTFSCRPTNEEFWLVGSEPRPAGAWEFDVRMFMKAEFIFIEISIHPLSIEIDLASFFKWIREQSKIRIEDEDGEPSGW